jgi:uncharacterized protein
MEFLITELERDPIDFDLSLAQGSLELGGEALQVGPLATNGRAEVIYEHRGPREIVADIRLKGHLQGTFEAPCARCVEPVNHPIATDFDLIFRPVGVDASGSERAIHAPDTEIGYYENGSLLLEDVLREQVLLALPAKTLCKPDCKGLCPRCGQNRNQIACSCGEGVTDPRWNTLAEISSRLKS